MDGNADMKLRVDVGLSWNAPCSRSWLKTFGDVYVIGYEPNPESCMSSMDLVERDGNLSRFSIRECALSDVDKKGKATFYKTDGDVGCSSLYRPNETLGVGFLETEVVVYPAGRIFTDAMELGFSVIELLKIDAQGSDMKILRNIKDDLQKSVVFLDVELDSSQYEVDDGYTEEDLMSFLLSLGFVHIESVNGNGRFYNQKFEKNIDCGEYTNDTVYPFT